MFIRLIVAFLSISSAFGTSNLLDDSIRLPAVSFGDLPAAASPAKPESFFDKLVSPFALLQGGFPCLGASSLKSGKCLSFDACVADGGFGDGKGLCLGDVVCCVKPVACGEISLLNNTILANPGFPAATNQGGSCSVKLVKPFGISHVKLVIHDLELAKPHEHTGKCELDSFTVSGGVSSGFNLGKICGLNAKTHLYIPTLLELTDVFINIDLAADSSIKRRWLIRAEFIEAKSSAAPPKGCVQYFREETGVITSLNFDINSMEGLGNIDGLKYAICFDIKSESCAIEFDSIFFHLGGNFTSHALPFTSDVSKKLFRSLNPEIEMEMRAARPAPRPLSSFRFGNNRPAPVAYPSYLAYPSAAYPPQGYPSPYQMAKPISAKYRPAYHRPSYYAPARYPISEFLYQVPSHIIRPYMHRPLSVLHQPSVYSPYSPYSAVYNAPMKKPGVDTDKLEILEDKFGKFDKLGEKLGDKFDGKLDKLEELLGLGEFKADGLENLKVCTSQDVLVFPIPDDGTSPMHCGNDLHFGQSLVSSNTPFVIKVSNKGPIHGKGFALNYKLKC